MVESGFKNSKFFLTLVKARQFTNHITQSVVDDGKYLVSTK